MSNEVDDDFREFVLARTPSLLRTAYLLTGDHHAAEDLLQVAFLKAYRHWPRVRTLDAPEFYLRRVLVNQRTSWWRRRRVAELSVATFYDAVDAGAERGEPAGGDLAIGVAERDLVWRAVQQLPPRTRAALVLRYWEDRPEAEIADLLGCSPGTVKSLASRGLDRLRTLLVPDLGPVPDSVPDPGPAPDAVVVAATYPDIEVDAEATAADDDAETDGEPAPFSCRAMPVRKGRS